MSCWSWQSACWGERPPWWHYRHHTGRSRCSRWTYGRTLAPLRSLQRARILTRKEFWNSPPLCKEPERKDESKSTGLVTHALISICFRSLKDMIHYPAAYFNLLNSVLTSTLNQSLNSQTGLWSFEDQPKCSHYPQMSPFCYEMSNLVLNLLQAQGPPFHTHTIMHSKKLYPNFYSPISIWSDGLHSAQCLKWDKTALHLWALTLNVGKYSMWAREEEAAWKDDYRCWRSKL